MEYLSSNPYGPPPSVPHAYQQIITFASTHYPLSAWLNYDVRTI